jgi:hypothetical protein
MSKWQPIETLKLNAETGYGVRIYAPSLIDPDWNPSGTAEGTPTDDDGITAAVWDPSDDSYRSITVTDATHWMPLPEPPVSA